MSDEPKFTWQVDKNIFEFENSMPDSSYLDFVKEDMDYVIEGFVGKTKECLAIEKEFASIKKEFGLNADKDESYKNYVLNKNIINKSVKNVNDSKQMKNIAAQLCKLTGFNQVFIVVRNLMINNAYTMPGCSLIRSATTEMPSLPTEHGKRYYDSSHQYQCYICLYIEMIDALTPEELTACVLHEIGHNFDFTITTYIFDMIYWATCIPGGPVTMLFNILRTQIRFGYDTILSWLDRTAILPILANLGFTLERFLSVWTGPLGKLSVVGTILGNIAQSNPVNAAFGFFGFGKETFADSYATSLGYGPYIISMMNKLDTIDVVTKFGIIPELYTSIGLGPCAVLLMLVDPHPEAQTRCKIILDDMEKVTKDPDLPKEMRKTVKANYEQCKKAYDAFLETDPDERNAVVTRWTRNIKEKIFNGKVDFRAALWSICGAKSAVQSR